MSMINSTTDFQALDPIINVNIIWLEAAGLFADWLWLVVFHFRSSQ